MKMKMQVKPESTEFQLFYSCASRQITEEQPRVTVSHVDWTISLNDINMRLFITLEISDNLCYIRFFSIL